MAGSSLQRELAVGRYRLELTATGFGIHAKALDAVVASLGLAIGDRSPGDALDRAWLEAQAAEAVRHETRDWICWRSNYTGHRPHVAIGISVAPPRPATRQESRRSQGARLRA
jgi:hypothetical protein